MVQIVTSPPPNSHAHKSERTAEIFQLCLPSWTPPYRPSNTETHWHISNDVSRNIAIYILIKTRA